MRYLQMIFGLILIVFGLNALFAFLPVPEKHGFALNFLNTLHEARYIFPIIGAIMVTSGTLLLINRWMGFALLLLLPISFNIFAFHLFHDRGGLVAAGPIFALTNFFIMRQRKQFKALFSQR